MCSIVEDAHIRLGIAQQMGADVILNFRNSAVVDEMTKLIGGRRVDASIEPFASQRDGVLKAELTPR